jgi:hypothetical protein
MWFVSLMPPQASTDFRQDMRLTLNPATSIPVLSPLKTRGLLAVSETNAFHIFGQSSSCATGVK